MPSRLPDAPPEDRKLAWLEAEANPKVELFTISRPLGARAPPGMFERILAVCQGFGHCHRVWRSGAHFVTTSLQDVQHLLIEVGEKEEGGEAPPPADGEASDEALLVPPPPAEVPATAPAAASAGSKAKDIELRISCIGDKKQRPGIWASLMYVRGLAQVCVDYHIRHLPY